MFKITVFIAFIAAFVLLATFIFTMRERGRWVVVQRNEVGAAMLLDTNTGTSWILVGHQWEPVSRNPQ